LSCGNGRLKTEGYCVLLRNKLRNNTAFKLEGRPLTLRRINFKTKLMAIDPNTGTVITLEEAQRFVLAFRAKHANEPKGFFVGMNKLNMILGQNDCMGVRIYNGIDDSTGKFNQVLVGVDSGGRDMTSGTILDRLGTCPPNCDPGTGTGGLSNP
jgi:hypothetical protein